MIDESHESQPEVQGPDTSGKDAAPAVVSSVSHTLDAEAGTFSATELLGTVPVATSPEPAPAPTTASVLESVVEIVAPAVLPAEDMARIERLASMFGVPHSDHHAATIEAIGQLTGHAHADAKALLELVGANVGV